MERPSDKARTGFYTPPAVGVDTINLPSVNGGALFFSTGADAKSGTVYVLSKDMPSIVKLVPAGESTSANAGGLIPSRPHNAAARGAQTRFSDAQRKWAAPSMNKIARFATARN